jgi:hypothetical protein
MPQVIHGVISFGYPIFWLLNWAIENSQLSNCVIKVFGRCLERFLIIGQKISMI